MELSKLAFQEELGILKKEIPDYFLEEDILNQRLNGDIKLWISQDDGIEWLNTIHVAYLPKKMPKTPWAQGGPRSDTRDLWRRW